MSEGKRRLKDKFSRYSTEELQEIYHENNQKEFGPAELEVVREMLESFGVTIPDQLEFPRTRKNAEAKAKQDEKSEEVKSQLEIVKGQGHNMWPGWFQSQNLVDFVIMHATKTDSSKGN